MKKYLFALFLSFTAYVILLVFSLTTLANGVDHPGQRVGITLLPVLPAFLICIVIFKEINRIDEMQRRLQLEALAISFAATGLITLGYGFLENVGYPKMSMFVIWPLMGTFWLIGVIFGRLRY
ncbi:hypothetical protein [Cochlodiniinecator piscidefendens]|uniref:hypothetical protein n=1 Tax=Cochlodiniinecator piscidefendens TaxID=2715756 RepID=UPI00140A7102|nr:hypothetical protein [Cochlodiniinecator piscidefendens]